VIPALPNISKQARELRAITPMALPHAPPHIGTVDSGSSPAMLGGRPPTASVVPSCGCQKPSEETVRHDH